MMRTMQAGIGGGHGNKDGGIFSHYIKAYIYIAQINENLGFFNVNFKKTLDYTDSYSFLRPSSLIYHRGYAL